MVELVQDVDACVSYAIEAVGKDLVVAAPLGLGKPVQLLNAFYRRAEADTSISLHIVTALCLEVPRPSDPIEASLAGPIMERLFRDYEELAFLQPLKRGTLPDNIKISEFYVRAGSMVGVAEAQQNYISSNYTHIARDMLGLGANVVMQLVAARESGDELDISLSSNPDVSLELFEQLKDCERKVVSLAQVHPDLPFMEHDAQVPADAFNLIVRNSDYDKALFAVPNGSVPLRDYATAVHASTLIVDGGTLQIGIGALGDALAHACILRHRDNAQYQQLVSALCGSHLASDAQLGSFDEGLYASTEMFVNGMLHLAEQGVIKRKVYDNLSLQQGLNSGAIGEQIDSAMYAYARDTGLMPQVLARQSLDVLQYWGIISSAVGLRGEALVIDQSEYPNDTDHRHTREALLAQMSGASLRNGRYLHGGFFLGPRDFYARLRELDEHGRESICMTGVNRTNQLLLDYPLYCAQRRNARFINTGMKVTLSGAVASDGLEDGTVISGVGGQYNFVAMAHDLPGARSILCIRSTRGEGEDAESNIVPHYGHCTIPRHLRDIVVTEYGVADLRGRSDAEIIERLINIADSRFQQSLLEAAWSAGKLPSNYTIPQWACNNTPANLQQKMAPLQAAGLLPDYPFGTELTQEELALAASLRKIKALTEEPGKMLRAVFRALLHREDEEAAKPWLERLHLEHPHTPREYLVQQLLLLDLEERGLLKVR